MGESVFPAGIEAAAYGRLARTFAEQGFFPSAHELLFARDPGLTWARRKQVFATTPHLRWELALSCLIHWVAGARREGEGRARALRNDRRLSGEASAFYFNALVSDCLEAYRGLRPAEPWESAWEAQAVAEYADDSLEYVSGGRTIPVWAYFPSRRHRFAPGNAIYRIMHAWGALAADLDTTAVVLARLLKSDPRRADIPGILGLLEDHVRGEGRHGMEKPAYDNGILPEDRGILLWIGEKHNELDAGVNLNVLCLLAALAERADPPGRDRALALAAKVLDFLMRHAERGTFARPGFLIYYPLASLAFLWHRFALAVEALPDPLRAAFDPGDACGRLGRHLAGLIEGECASDRHPWNAFDTLLALPLLLRTGSKAADGLAREEVLGPLAEAASAQAFEFGKFPYPVTFLYGNRALGPCAALMACLELRRRGLREDARRGAR
jgi:hypothetical protein